jgi:transposase-like protein
MNILEQARAFVESLLGQTEGKRCPHCGLRLTKRNGSYRRVVRDVGGPIEVRVQRYWCHVCDRSYSQGDQRWARWGRYARRVQRKALDLYVYLGGSLRAVSEVMRGEVVAGAGRSRVWEPWLAEAEAGVPGACLSHVTVWRWGQRAGERAMAHRLAGAWRGVLRASGQLVADATVVCVRGMWHSIHLIAELTSRVPLSLERLAAEQAEALAGRFRAALHAWGLKASQVKLLVSDGASPYCGVLEKVLRQAAHQRCLYHLWRNILPAIRAYKDQAGETAALFVRFAIKALWRIATLEEAYLGLEDLERTFGGVQALQDTLRTIRRTLREAMAHTRDPTFTERTSTVAERFFRGYKGRTKRMGCFMSLPGCDHFTAAWQVYAAFQPCQLRKERKRHYCYPGQSPLQIAQADVGCLSWLDALQI